MKHGLVFIAVVSFLTTVKAPESFQTDNIFITVSPLYLFLWSYLKRFVIPLRLMLIKTIFKRETTGAFVLHIK